MKKGRGKRTDKSAYRSGKLASRRKGRRLLLATTALLVLVNFLPASRKGSEKTAASPRDKSKKPSESITDKRSNGKTPSLSTLTPIDNDKELRKGDPLAVLGGPKLLLVDSKGNFLNRESSQPTLDLPVITGMVSSTDLIVIEAQWARFLKVLRLLEQIRKIDFPLYSKISEVNLNTQHGIIINLIDGTLPVVVGDGQWERKMAYLSATLSKIEEEGTLKNVALLDLRFQGQVVTKLKKGAGGGTTKGR